MNKELPALYSAFIIKVFILAKTDVVSSKFKSDETSSDNINNNSYFPKEYVHNTENMRTVELAYVMQEIHTLI